MPSSSSHSTDLGKQKLAAHFAQRYMVQNPTPGFGSRQSDSRFVPSAIMLKLNIPAYPIRLIFNIAPDLFILFRRTALRSVGSMRSLIFVHTHAVAIYFPNDKV